MGLVSTLKNKLKFITEYLEDILIVIGMLCIVGATLMVFGLGIALYVIGVFLITISLIDPHKLTRGR
jgi:hypothetical protein